MTVVYDLGKSHGWIVGGLAFEKQTTSRFLAWPSRYSKSFFNEDVKCC